MSILYSYQREASLCDVTIVCCGGGQSVGHAAVLAAASYTIEYVLSECKPGVYKR